VFICVITL